MNFNLQTRNGIVSFISTLTDLAAAEICDGMDSNFARDLVAQWRSRGLSESQRGWMHKLAMDSINPPAPRPQANCGNLAGIIALFDKASEKLKFPKISFVHEGKRFQLQRAGGNSKSPGAVNLTDGGKFGNNVWYGRIERDGNVSTSRSWTENVQNLLAAMAENPAEFAANKGKEGGCCIFCRKELTDARSLAVGYGETCAGHYGLAWG